METSRYQVTLPFLKDEKAYVLGRFLQELKGKPYIQKFAVPGVLPEVIIGETFINLVESSIEIGNTDIMTNQYEWTITMLEPRGVDRKDFIKDFYDIIDTADKVINENEKNKHVTLWSEFFNNLKVEIEETINR